MLNLKRFGKKWSWPNFEVLSRHLPGGTEENSENFNQDNRSPGPKIESADSRIRSRSVNHSTMTYGGLIWG
jgi:hypothetical protein